VSGRSKANRERLRGSLVVVPALAVVMAIALGVLLPLFDRTATDERFTLVLFGGGPDAARSVLGTVTGSVITVASLTFSLTVITLQLASSQFSPRLLRTFVRDRVTQVTLAVFLATFVYGLLVLRTVRSNDDPGGGFVPRVAVTVAIVLAVLSTAALVTFLGHVTTVMRVDTLMRDVHSQTTKAIGQLYGEEPREVASSTTVPVPPPGARSLPAPQSGFVQEMSAGSLLGPAARAGLVVRLDVSAGDHVIEGEPVGLAWTTAGTECPTDGQLEGVTRAMRQALAIGFERTPRSDVAFGLRQLVDIAAKALSPGVNDPTTAVHAVGHLAALLAGLAARDLGPEVVRDDEGMARVVVRRPDFAELLGLVCGQPRRYGAGEPALVLALLELLATVAGRVAATGDPERRRHVLDQLDRLISDAERETSNPLDLVGVRRLAADVRATLLPGPERPATSRSGRP